LRTKVYIVSHADTKCVYCGHSLRASVYASSILFQIVIALFANIAPVNSWTILQGYFEQDLQLCSCFCINLNTKFNIESGISLTLYLLILQTIISLHSSLNPVIPPPPNFSAPRAYPARVGSLRAGEGSPATAPRISVEPRPRWGSRPATFPYGATSAPVGVRRDRRAVCPAPSPRYP